MATSANTAKAARFVEEIRSIAREVTSTMDRARAVTAKWTALDGGEFVRPYLQTGDGDAEPYQDRGDIDITRDEVIAVIVALENLEQVMTEGNALNLYKAQ